MAVDHRSEEWLTEAYDYEQPKRGQIRKGVILEFRDTGLFVDVGLKQDGFVPIRDIERLEEEPSELKPGREVVTRVIRPRDRDGKLLLSLYQARFEKDWQSATALLESGEIWQGEVTDYNRGGLVAQFDNLRAFCPASHLWTDNRRYLSAEEKEEVFRQRVGKELAFKVIEVDSSRRRLIVSERLAQQELRHESMDRLLDELTVDQVCKGTVRHLADFGAFVDLGGADGLVHISELTWRRVRHPREVVRPGDEVDVYVLSLDRERKRISLSLKRLQPDPWELVDEVYKEGQLVSGMVTNVTDFGAFVALDAGVEGLIHISELADPPPVTPGDIVSRGEELVLRILRVDSLDERIALSLNWVDPEEREAFLAQQEASVAGQEEVKDEDEQVDEQPSDVEAPEPAQEQTSGTPADEGFWQSLLSDMRAESGDSGS